SWVSAVAETAVAANKVAAEAVNRSRLCKTDSDRKVRLSSLIVSPSPIFRDANADQLRIRQEHVSCETAIVAIQKVSRNCGLIEYVFVIQHHLPTFLACKYESEIDIGVPPDAVIRVVVEHPGPRIILPVIISTQCTGPIGAQRN